MSEARRSERIRAFLGAKIIFNNRMSIVDCVVRNISATGAKLALAGSLPITGEFALQIPQKGMRYTFWIRNSMNFHPNCPLPCEQLGICVIVSQ